MIERPSVCGIMFGPFFSKKTYHFKVVKFDFLRMIEIGAKSFPEIFHMKGMAQEVCEFFLVKFFFLSVCLTEQT